MNDATFLFIQPRVTFDRDKIKHSLGKGGKASLIALIKRSKSHSFGCQLLMRKISFSLVIKSLTSCIHLLLIFCNMSSSLKFSFLLSALLSLSIFVRTRKNDFPIDFTFFASSKSLFVKRVVVKMRKIS